jgi:hypothetical protein
MEYCSNCGERILEKQQFCRACGSELAADAGGGFDPRALVYIGLFATLAGALIVLVGEFAGTKTISFLGAIIALISFGLMLTGALLSDRPRRRRKSARPGTGTPTLEKADTTNRLPPITAEDHFAASVTEETTTKLQDPR